MDDNIDERFVNITINETVTYSPEIKYLIGAVTCLIILFVCIISAVFLVAMEDDNYYSPYEESFFENKLEVTPKLIVSDAIYNKYFMEITKFSIDNNLTLEKNNLVQRDSIIILENENFNRFNQKSLNGALVYDPSLNSIYVVIRDKSSLNMAFEILSIKNIQLDLLTYVDNDSGKEIYLIF